MQQIRNLYQTKSAPFVEHFRICYKILVRERGLEPPRPEGHQPLKLTRLPIPPLAHRLIPVYYNEVTVFCKQIVD